MADEKNAGERSSSLSNKAASGSKDNLGERGSHDRKKGKQAAKVPSTSAESVRSVLDDSQHKLLEAINSLQNSISKQNNRMNEQEKQLVAQGSYLHEISDKMASYEHENDYYCDYEEGDPSEMPVEEMTHQESGKRALEEENETQNSRFSAMAKRFRAAEPCDSEIDSMLAMNINELFRSGIDDVRYQELVNGERNARPANCEGLVVVQTNPLIWDAISPVARSTDKKLQNIETSIVKGATVLAKVVNNMASMEMKFKSSQQSLDCEEVDSVSNKFSKLIDDCNDTLALMGHSNKQINLARKDFLRPELNKDYSHLCNHNRPFTNLLFGDDVSKSAKEIEDCSKISNRMVGNNRPFRGGPRRRGGFGRYPRSRGSYGRGEKSRGSSYGESSNSYQAKHSYRRGSRPGNRQ